MRIVTYSSLAVFLLMLFLSIHCVAQEQTQPAVAEQQPATPPEWVRIITPPENAEFIGKRPEIKAEFIAPI